MAFFMLAAKTVNPAWRSAQWTETKFSKSGGKLKIIGVGGICSAEDALEKLEAGACLVQVYSGMIYAGPGLVKSINKAILKKMA